MDLRAVVTQISDKIDELKYTIENISLLFRGKEETVQKVDATPKIEEVIAQLVALNSKEEEPLDITALETSLESLESYFKTLLKKEPVSLAQVEKILKEVIVAIKANKPESIGEKIDALGVILKPRETVRFDEVQMKALMSALTNVGGGGGGGGSLFNVAGNLINPATEDTLQSILAASGGGAYETRIDEVSATVSYIGKATPGAATSDASWQISKLDETTGLVLSYADDVTTFTKVWDNRATYTY